MTTTVFQNLKIGDIIQHKSDRFQIASEMMQSGKYYYFQCLKFGFREPSIVAVFLKNSYLYEKVE